MGNIIDRLIQHLETFGEKLLEFIPDLLVIVIIIISGFITASIIRYLLVKAFHAVRFDDWSDQIGLATAFKKAGITGSPSGFMGSFVYWFTVVLFFVAGFATLGFRVTDAIVSIFLTLLPRFFTALLIVLLGFFITKYLARAVLIAGVTAGIEYSKALSELVRVLLFVLVFAMALEELAIAPRVVLAAFVIFFGAIGAAAAVAFGLAGRDYARRAVDYLLSRHEGDDIDQL